MHELLKKGEVLPHELTDVQEISQKIDELKADIIEAVNTLATSR